MADVLYGVTMEEHGVSKIVKRQIPKSRRASDANRHGLARNADGQPADTEEDAPHKREETLEISLAK